MEQLGQHGIADTGDALLVCSCVQKTALPGIWQTRVTKYQRFGQGTCEPPQSTQTAAVNANRPSQRKPPQSTAYLAWVQSLAFLADAALPPGGCRMVA